MLENIIILILIGLIIFLSLFIYARHIVIKTKKAINTHKEQMQEYTAKAEKKYQIVLDKLKEDYVKLETQLQKEYTDKRENNLKELAAQIELIGQRLETYKQERETLIQKEIHSFAKTKVQEYIEKLDYDLVSMHRLYTSKIHEIKNNAELTEEEITKKLEDLQSQENAAIQARIRQYEESHKEDFYKIMINNLDIEEAQQLEELVVRFRNPIPLRKAIYDVYYKLPIQDMINRITRGERVCGVYKITHLETGQCYIGQSVDIGNRWLQHCKRGAGVESKTNLKLYAAMEAHGLFSFKFEIIEEVPANLLNSREKYWSEYFGAKLFGYSIRS
jgi:hypothetical protein